VTTTTHATIVYNSKSACVGSNAVSWHHVECSW